MFPFRWMTISLPLNLGFLMRAQILNWTTQNISTLVEMVSFNLDMMTRSALSGYQKVKCVESFNSLVRVRLYWYESDIASRWVHRESNLMFTLSSDKDQRKKFAHAFAFAQCERTLNLMVVGRSRFIVQKKVEVARTHRSITFLFIRVRSH